VMVGILFAFPKLAPESLVVRVLDFSTMYGNPNSSAAQRLDVWREAIYTWSKDPILGIGLTGFPVADNYYIRMLVELGVVGLLIFLLCLLQFGWTGVKVYQGGRSARSRLFISIGISYLCTMMAILIYAVSLDAFQPIRDMNILWYYTGIMFALGPMLQRRSLASQQAPQPVPRGMVRAPSPLRLPS
jgi:O-antigen ligase